MADAKFMMFHVPQDPELLRAIGVVSIRHAHLDHMLRMTIKVLANVTVDEAVLGTAALGSAALRKRVNKLARRALGDGVALIRLQAMLERCRLATENRNELIHGLFGQELDEEPQFRNRRNEWQPIPTAKELDTLADKIGALTKELNDARLSGFLSEALIERRHGSKSPAKKPAEWRKD